MGGLEDNTGFITGAAGSIGAATARRFAAEGARVLAVNVLGPFHVAKLGR